ncbi:hypothetical protein D6C84_03241 [Aureobasidium pullulans]|uniref:Uncharacterized protein n=1 Tax=Aureobasidium pullulans TaxID=5580 RepID=A0A4S9Y382_AURPU|nr:hypothetical protein D6C84_03241 [Aureobasidium pullulans]
MDLKEDWPVHSTVCKQFAKLGDRPSPNMIRAIYFPADDTEPEFKWVPNKVARKDYGWHEAPEWEGKDPYGSYNTRHLVLRCDKECRGRYHKEGCYNIWIKTLEDDEANEFEWANDCVKELTEDLNTTWKGPILAYGNEQHDYHHFARVKAIDLDTTDLKGLALAFFLGGSSEHCVKAVQINCVGHMKRYKAPEFESKVVDWRQFTMADAHCQILKMIGLPLALHDTKTDDGLDTHNVKASLLKTIGPLGRKKLGNMIVVHDHGKHISPHTVQALCIWIDKGLRPFFNLARKLNRNGLKLIKHNEPQREQIAAQISGRHDKMIEKISKDKYLEYHKGRMDDEDSTDEDMPDDYSAEEESEDDDDGTEE